MTLQMCSSEICAGLEKLSGEEMWMGVNWLQQRGCKLYKDVWSVCPRSWERSWEPDFFSTRWYFCPVLSPPQIYATFVVNTGNDCMTLSTSVRRCLRAGGRCKNTGGVIWGKQCSEETASAKRSVGKQTCRTRNQWKRSQPPKDKTEFVHSIYFQLC